MAQHVNSLEFSRVKRPCPKKVPNLKQVKFCETFLKFSQTFFIHILYFPCPSLISCPKNMEKIWKILLGVLYFTLVSDLKNIYLGLQERTVLFLPPTPRVSFLPHFTISRQHTQRTIFFIWCQIQVKLCFHR